ncbi:tripartite tricarboxylate transporter substrate binding protein [Alteribacillus sp. HJP-4]|uniref:tripartite tricarboxylate transporter substrate binding protein n=1 Tax=Alteribacillus sp. HJP-4 TaxID=2775394 RepID=UPI0035CD0D6C
MKNAKKLFMLLFIMVLAGIIAAGCGNMEEESDGENDGDEAEGSEDSGNEESESAGDGDYPERTIEVYVGHGAGGGTDIFARQVAGQLEDELGTNFNVINREGAGGTIAKEEAANQPADGYTLVAISSFPVSTALGTNPAGLDVLTPIARFQADTFGLMADPEKFEDIDAFIEEAEDNPGELTIGGVSTGSIDEITTQRFVQESGLDVSYVPFDGSGDAVAALLSGNVDAVFEEIGPTLDYMDSGDLHPLVFFTEERLEDFSDVPTSVEQGWEMTEGVERGFAIHTDTPQEIIDQLEEAMKNVYDSEEYKEHEEAQYLHYREGWLNSEDYRDKLEQDIELYREAAENLESN